MSEQLRMPSLHRIATALCYAILARPARVVVLHNASRPSHVAGFVVAVIVDAVKRQFRRWPLADVCEEGGKTLAPTFANLNASPAVIAERFLLLIVTARFHALPQLIFGAGAHAVFAETKKILASTRRRRADSQSANEHISLYAAHASAREKPQAVLMRCFGQHGPVTDNRPWRYAPEQ